MWHLHVLIILVKKIICIVSWFFSFLLWRSINSSWKNVCTKTGLIVFRLIAMLSLCFAPSALTSHASHGSFWKLFNLFEKSLQLALNQVGLQGRIATKRLRISCKHTDVIKQRTHRKQAMFVWPKYKIRTNATLDRQSV